MTERESNPVPYGRTTAGLWIIDHWPYVLGNDTIDRATVARRVVEVERQAALLAVPPASSPAPVGIDRLTLDQAMAAAGIHVARPGTGAPREVGCRSCKPGVAAIAREYDRLAGR